MVEVKKVKDEKNLNTVMKFNDELDIAMTPYLPEFLADYKHPAAKADDPYWHEILEGNKAVSALAYLDNNPIGMIIIKFNDKIAIIESLFVIDEYRKQGIGKKLLEFANSEAKERECGVMFINVLIENVKAKKLYKELGFNDFRTTLVKKI